MLQVKNLSFSYFPKRSESFIFRDLSIQFSHGINAILGPNGAGKTTLLKSIFGLLDCSGEVWYADDNVTKMSISEKTKLMAYLPQLDVDSSALTVLEMVLLGRLPDLRQRVSDHDLHRVMQTLESLNIAQLAPKSFDELSGGQKKLVFIAQTLVREPRIILLDEPVNSLDLQKQLELCQLLQRIAGDSELCIVVVLHDINLAARFADRVVVIEEGGRLYASGTPNEVIDETMLREVYGVIASVQCDSSNHPTVSAICSVRK